MEADVAGLAAIHIKTDDVDAFAIRSPARPAGSGRSTRGILAARYDQETGSDEEGRSD